MTAIIIGSIILSLIHASIPNHWLPVVAIGREENWSVTEVKKVTLITALAHGLSTVIIGIFLAMAGVELAKSIQAFTQWIGPSILIVLGIIFIYRNHHHHHAVEKALKKKATKFQIISALTIAMFFSPCMEIEAYFLLAGSYGKWLVMLISLIYVVFTAMGMIFLVGLIFNGSLKYNWNKLEHKISLITGITLIFTGILAFFIS